MSRSWNPALIFQIIVQDEEPTVGSALALIVHVIRPEVNGALLGSLMLSWKLVMNKQEYTLMHVSINAHSGPLLNEATHPK